MTLKEAIASLMYDLGEFKRATCPCCGKVTQYHEFSLDKHGRNALAYLEAHGESRSQDIARYVGLGNNNHTKLRHLGLVTEGNRPGTWRLSRRGRQFVEGKIGSPKTVTLLNNKPVDMSDDFVMFAEL